MKSASRLILFFSLLFASVTAQATVDVRMGFGHTWGDPASLNENIPAGLQMKGLNILGFDIIGNPMGLAGFGGGLRFDNFSKIKKDAGDEYSFRSSVLTALLNYRVINNSVYAGPIIGIGMAHSTDLKSKIGGTGTSYNAEKNRSFSLGAEGGIHIGHLALGGEFGYIHFKSRDFKDDSGGFLVNTDTGNKKNAGFSGTYMRFLVGIRF
ncbi:MAG: hypothetical protein ACOYL6_00070 [Bacteriovoracaceae bacterium]